VESHAVKRERAADRGGQAEGRIGIPDLLLQGQQLDQPFGGPGGAHPLAGAADGRGSRADGGRRAVGEPAGAEHAAGRSRAGLFDVSHMGEFTVRGPQAVEFVQFLTVNDVERAQPGQAQYSALCDQGGRVLDDLLVYRFPDRFLLVVNASNRAKNWRWACEHAAAFDVVLSDDSDKVALVALQGPLAEKILAPLAVTARPNKAASVSADGLPAIRYYRFVEGSVAGVDALVSRTGYTGEDGFELYVPADGAAEVWQAVHEAGRPHGLVAAGLGARDSLRLEMGYALYGNDLSEEYTAIESGLGWIVKPDKGDFIGRDALAAEKARGPARRLAGIRLLERGFPRPGYPLIHDGEAAGAVTSGVASPTLGTGLALGYLPAPLARPGTEIGVGVRGRVLAGRTQRPPFYTGGSIRR